MGSSTPVSFNCVQVNLGRSRNAMHELEVYAAQNTIDFIFITEPYLNCHSHSIKFTSNYQIYQFPSSTPALSPIKSAILIRNNICSTIGLTNHSDTNISIIKINTITNKSIYLISVYIEPRIDINNTINKLEHFFIDHPNSIHLVCGDFNGWHTAWGSNTNNSRGNTIFNIITLHDLIVCNIGNTPTFETVTHQVHRQSIIDVTLLSNTTSAHVHNWKIDLAICPSSDHNAITFHFNTTNHQPSINKKLSTYRYNTTHTKWHQIKDQFIASINSRLPIDAHNHIKHLSINQLDEFVTHLTTAIQQTCDSLLPRSSHHLTRIPWWNEELTHLKSQVIRNHHHLSRLVRQRRPLDQILHERQTLKKQYSDAICKYSTSHFKDFCNKQTKDDVWTITNKIIKSSPLSQPPSTLRLPDGSYTTDSTETANALLQSLFPDDTPDDSESQKRLTDLMSHPIHNQNEPPFTTLEIIECIKSMNPKRSPGPDHLTADICHHFSSWFPDIITSLMNRCIELHHFPINWKIAYTKIIAKPNKTDYSDSSSFRPIGLINVFGKLLEKLITQRLTHHININHHNCPHQFGFKQQISTAHAIHSALNIINHAKSEKKHVIAISLDIKAAFDNAWWPAIFNRLRTIDCPTNLFMTLKSYVTDRQVYLNFSDCTVTKTMTKGCIQGSVFGPTLWNILLDTLLITPFPEGCHIQAFADDILLIVQSSNIINLETTTHHALNIITDWGHNIKLTFGPQKTQIISFTHKALSSKIFMHGHQLIFSNHIKYLGIIIDRHLKFTHHVEYIIEKAKSLFHKLITYTKPTWGVHSDNIKIIYTQVIQPIICYASSIWSGSLKYKYIIKRLLSIQRLFAIKIIRGFRTVSTAASISIAQLTPLPDKILEIADIESSKINNSSRFIPHVPLQLPVKPLHMPHPSVRVGISFREINTLTEYEALGEELDGYWQIFTDGSKSDTDQVGAAFIAINPSGHHTHTKHLKLSNHCSVFQSELLAIKESLSWIIRNNIHKSFIFSDSHSGLTELKNSNSHNHFAHSIHTSIRHIHSSNHIIKFAWVRGHIGITGNELADLAAKSAAAMITPPHYIHIPISYIKLQNSKIANEKAAQLYSQCSDHIKTILPTFQDLTTYLSLVKPSFIITQFLTNHGYHKSYLHRFKITADDLCPCDDSSPQTLDHLIRHCPRFMYTRIKHTSNCHHNINPFSLIDIMKHPSTLATFHDHIIYIIRNLKSFNNT